MHNRIHDSVIDLAVQCTYSGPGDDTPPVCAEFLGPEIGWSTVVSAFYDNSLDQG